MAEENQTGGLMLIGGRLCLDFCNTVDERLGEHPHDLLATNRYRAFVRWGHKTGALNEAQFAHLIAFEQGATSYAEDVFQMAIDLREVIYRLFLARLHTEHLPEQDLSSLNRAWQSTQQERQLRLADDGQAVEQAWNNPFAPEIVLWEITKSAVETLINDDPSRIRQCPGCGWLFYDQSKNNRRTWCDMRFCGNRAKNKRFHDRRRGGSTN